MENWIREIMLLAEQYEPCMSLAVDERDKTVTLILDTEADTYGEWIPGEGADICLLRRRSDNRVIGVELPLYRNNLAIHHQGELRINEGFLKVAEAAP